MKIIGVSASARKNKSTHFLLEQSLNESRNTAEMLGKQKGGRFIFATIPFLTR
jgi:hypothetical protein